MAKPKLKVIQQPVTKLDLGCGKNKKPGFTGVDAIAFEGVDVVMNIGKEAWPWPDESIEEVHCSHFVEHLDVQERIHFVNELYRVMKPGATAQVITPHGFSGRAFGDLTHKWPPVHEFWFYYLDKAWREVNAPHNDFYTCDFSITWGNNLHPMIQTRNQEYQMHALTFFKEAAQDTVSTWKKK